MDNVQKLRLWYNVSSMKSTLPYYISRTGISVGYQSKSESNSFQCNQDFLAISKCYIDSSCVDPKVISIDKNRQEALQSFLPIVVVNQNLEICLFYGVTYELPTFVYIVINAYNNNEKKQHQCLIVLVQL